MYNSIKNWNKNKKLKIKKKKIKKISDVKINILLYIVSNIVIYIKEINFIILWIYYSIFKYINIKYIHYM